MGPLRIDPFRCGPRRLTLFDNISSGDGVRFDDRIATVLAQPEPDRLALRAKWHQLADLLAQPLPIPDGPELEQALAFLERHRAEVDPDARRHIAAYLAGDMPSHLSAFFDSDPPSEPIRVSPSAQKAETHIRDLVARLDSFRKDRDGPAGAGPKASSFRWETGADGVILWVEGVHRGPLIGQTIASPASTGGFGADERAADAFKKRSPFRDASFCVTGSGPASGNWRISGVPFFDAREDRFLGYRGSARRPRAEEESISALSPAAGLFGTDLHPDSLRQLIHEIKTPLNAIVGFAEMIDGQYLGPAADGYRARAAAIRQEAARLLSAVEDLDTAARIETSRFPVEESMIDLQSLLRRLHGDYIEIARARGALLSLDFGPGLPAARVEPESAERMIARMLAATLGLAVKGEALSARMVLEKGDGGNMLCLSISRPRAIAGRREDELLDPGFTPEGDWPEAPALGLGFALRLVRNLAETVGGSLVIAADSFVLQLPAAGSAMRRGD